MHELQASRVSLHQVDAGYTAVMYLLEELPEVCPALMTDPCFGEETATGSALVDAQTQVNIFAETHGRESAQLTVKAATDAHVERARIELLVHLLLAATDAASRDERSHTVADGLLNGGEAIVSPVWTAPSVAFLPAEFCIHLLQEVRRQDAIAIEEDEEFALAVFSTEIASLSGPAILLCVITQRELACIAMHYVFARLARTVLHDDDLHILERLLREALQQFVHLVWAVVYGNYD